MRKKHLKKLWIINALKTFRDVQYPPVLMTHHGYAVPHCDFKTKVSSRNARERNRVKTVNIGFEMLKKQIPSAASVKKMSKVNILTQAVDYIETLQSLLSDSETSSYSIVSMSRSSGRGLYPPPSPHLQAPGVPGQWGTGGTGGVGASSGEPSSPSPYGSGRSGGQGAVSGSERHSLPETKYAPSHSPSSGLISSDNRMEMNYSWHSSDHIMYYTNVWPM